MKFKGTIIIRREEEWYVATCLENNIASQGKTIDEAIENLKEAIALFYMKIKRRHTAFLGNLRPYILLRTTKVRFFSIQRNFNKIT